MNAVHLDDLRCDGSGHGGCHANCLFIWKEEWLRPVDPAVTKLAIVSDAPAPAGRTGCTEEDVRKGARAPGETADAPDPSWVCQATQSLEFSTPLRPWDLGQYVEDYASGNVSAWTMISGFAYLAFSMIENGRYGLGAPLRFLYDVFAKITGITPFPARPGKIPLGGKTPSRKLDLQAGELVRVRDLPEILETVDESLRNRGMQWHSELVPYSGKTLRVIRRVERIINEKNGKMIHFKNDCIMLEGALCKGRYIDNSRRFCPRGTQGYFREIWLERVEEPPAQVAASPDRQEAALPGRSR